MLTVLGGSAATIAAFQVNMSWLALFGILGAALLASALNREDLRRDRAIARRQEEKAVVLDQLATRLDEIAAEIGAGRPQSLVAFVDAVTNRLVAPYAQWLGGAAQAEATLSEMNARLVNLGYAEGAEIELVH